MDDKSQFDVSKLGQDLVEYCQKYFIDPDVILDILYDQKVAPMIRGKGMEYNAYNAIRSTLNEREWIVEKLNLAAQPGTPDQDISVRHRRTNILITVESKSAVRGSFHVGSSRTIIKNEPHFKVKCHRSRSNKQLDTNDRYHFSSFDIIITNPLNSIYKGKSIGADFEFVDEHALKILYDFYGVSDTSELEQRTANDWRFVRSSTIAVDEYIPRTPFLKLKNDNNWKTLQHLEQVLLQIVNERRNS